jgi:hypothetical protein
MADSERSGNPEDGKTGEWSVGGGEGELTVIQHATYSMSCGQPDTRIAEKGMVTQGSPGGHPTRDIC